MAGNHNSTRWKGHTRRAAVEECERIRAGVCGECGRKCKAVYRLPAGCEHRGQVAGHVWACRRCHDLTYARCQARRTSALPLLFEPMMQAATLRAAMSASQAEMMRAPFGLRDEAVSEHLWRTASAVEKARRYKVPARRYKPRKARALSN